jgi:hypothetical protein
MEYLCNSEQNPTGEISPRLRLDEIDPDILAFHNVCLTFKRVNELVVGIISLSLMIEIEEKNIDYDEKLVRILEAFFPISQEMSTPERATREIPELSELPTLLLVTEITQINHDLTTFERKLLDISTTMIMMEARKSRLELCEKKKLKILSRDELIGPTLDLYQRIKPHLETFETVVTQKLEELKTYLMEPGTNHKMLR